MITFTDLIIYGLAVWRISNLLVNESGPFFIFRKIRDLFGIKSDVDGFVYHIPETFMAQVLSCVWCCSFWVSCGLLVLWRLSPTLSLKTAVIFAFSAIAIVIHSVLEKLNKE